MEVRTFIAVLLADEIKKQISQVQEQVKKLAPKVKWVEPENFHVTLKFLGNVNEDALESVYQAVEKAVKGFTPFEVSIAGIGAFPNTRNARVVWIGIQEGHDTMAKMATSVDAELAKLGHPKEKREFRSHITIGRVKAQGHLDKLARGIEKIDARDLGRQTVSSVAVMRSDLRPEGALYTPLKVIAFEGLVA